MNKINVRIIKPHQYVENKEIVDLNKIYFENEQNINIQPTPKIKHEHNPIIRACVEHFNDFDKLNKTISKTIYLQKELFNEIDLYRILINELRIIFSSKIFIDFVCLDLLNYKNKNENNISYRQICCNIAEFICLNTK